MLHSPDAPHVQDGTIPPLAPGAKGRNELFAHIVADDGTECLGWYAVIASARSVIEENLKDLLIGQDPFNTEKLWDNMFWRVRGYGRKGSRSRRSPSDTTTTWADIAESRIWSIRASGQRLHWKHGTRRRSPQQELQTLITRGGDGGSKSPNRAQHPDRFNNPARHDDRSKTSRSRS